MKFNLRNILKYFGIVYSSAYYGGNVIVMYIDGTWITYHMQNMVLYMCLEISFVKPIRKC